MQEPTWRVLRQMRPEPCAPSLLASRLLHSTHLLRKSYKLAGLLGADSDREKKKGEEEEEKEEEKVVVRAKDELQEGWGHQISEGDYTSVLRSVAVSLARASMLIVGRTPRPDVRLTQCTEGLGEQKDLYCHTQVPWQRL